MYDRIEVQAACGVLLLSTTNRNPLHLRSHSAHLGPFPSCLLASNLPAMLRHCELQHPYVLYQRRDVGECLSEKQTQARSFNRGLKNATKQPR